MMLYLSGYCFTVSPVGERKKVGHLAVAASQYICRSSLDGVHGKRMRICFPSCIHSLLSTS